MATKLRPVKSESLSAGVYRAIKQAIQTGKLRPGDPLRELHLARELQVSQATIREVLVLLEQKGLVVRLPNRGTTVTNLSRKEVEERIALRVLLEGIAFAEAAARMEERDFSELDRLARSINSAAAHSPFGLAQADLQFHAYVWQLSGNETLAQTLEQLTAPLFAFISIIRRKGLAEGRPRIHPHETLIEALRTRDPERIKQAVCVHIRTSPYDRFICSGAGDVQEFASSLN